MKKLLLQSPEEDFIKALDHYNIFEQDKFGNDIVHYIINNIKEVKINFNTVMDTLLKKGLDINTKQLKGKFQRSYLQLSVVINDKNIFDYILEKGADVNSTDANGNSILSDAAFNYLKDKENYGYYIEKLIERGADPYKENNYGVSAFSLANQIANSDVRKYFK